MNRKQLSGVIIITVIIIAAFVGLVVHSKKATPSSGTNSMSMTAAVSTNSVEIKDYMFSPMAIKVKVGSKATWTNKDAVSHTITADNPSGDAPSSMDIAQNQSFSFTFNKAGTYTYHCFPHPYMHGTVTVTN